MCNIVSVTSERVRREGGRVCVILLVLLCAIRILKH